MSALSLFACDADPADHVGAERISDHVGEERTPDGNQVEMLDVEDCLPALYRARAARDEDYDRANDHVRGGTVSCGLSVTASEMRDVLADLRRAAETGDHDALLKHVGVPMTYVDREGSVRELPSREDVDAIYDEVFTPTVMTELKALRLEDGSVVPGEGIFFDLGAVWLVVPEGETGPQLVTVNHQAAEEAAAAALKAAEAGERRE